MLKPEMEKATFAGGCFWGVEHLFNEMPGVTDAVSGYAGGSKDNPTYEQVSSGRTGHAEAVEVTFDPAKVTYDELLNAFWNMHDPTTLNRQGPDHGHQYRSAIFFHSVEQEAAVRKSAAEAQRYFDRPIVTEIVPAPLTLTPNLTAPPAARIFSCEELSAFTETVARW